jgi:hypothetical protein
MAERVYKYKLDFYYVSLIVYFVFLVIYVVLRGTFSANTFEVVIQDPIIYIIIAFIVLFLILLISNIIRGRELIFDERKLVLKSRIRTKEIPFGDILFIKFSREKKRRSTGSSPVRIVKLKLRNRKRYLRIRLSEFNNEKHLINEFRTISKGLTAQH